MCRHASITATLFWRVRQSDDWRASTSDECCSSCDHRHTQVRPRTVANTAHRTALSQCARVTCVQALHHGAQLLVRSSPAVLGRPLPTSLRRRFSAASQVRQSTTPGPSATPIANVRLTGFLCCWPVSLELTVWQFWEICALAETASVDYWKHICSLCTEASSTLEVVRACAVQFYYLLNVAQPPKPPLGLIWTVMLVWRKGNINRTVSVL